MAKPAPYFCTSCQAKLLKWAGQCPQCRQWNTVEEVAVETKFQGYSGTLQQVCKLDAVDLTTTPRISTTMAELDRVLGGGIVPGSVILIGGDPGVGKSTGLLQVSCQLSQNKKILYVTGEESLQQIAMRAKRLGLPTSHLLLLAETQVEKICAIAEQENPLIIVVDSIQTMQVSNSSSLPGSVSQVRESAAHLTQFAKMTNTAFFLVGHVTKSGDLAGPRVLEHIIDVVCYFEGNRDSRFRIIRAIKNRFGAVNEIGVFAMTDTGLKEISNPSAIFLSDNKTSKIGSAIMIIWEGSRPLLIELQALVDQSAGESPRRITVGLDQNRLSMLLAVLHKHGSITTANQDVFINVVGGVKALETSVDLALIMAIVSSLNNHPLPTNMIFFGEIGLSGEIRPVPNGIERLKEAAKHGFGQGIIPTANTPKKSLPGFTSHGVDNLKQALDLAFSA